MHYQQLPSLLRLLLLSTLILPSFAVKNNEDFERNFNYRYIEPLTASGGVITLSIPPAEPLDVPFNNLQPTNVQASTIAVQSIKTRVSGQNDVGVPITLTPPEIWCQCFADKAGRETLAVPFTVGPGMAIGAGPNPIASIFCSDQRGLKKYIVDDAAKRVFGVKERLDKLRRGKQTKKAWRLSS
ncbi:MAG: hypothetical protein Q9177_005997 [Variospora cf. flavescens]